MGGVVFSPLWSKKIFQKKIDFSRGVRFKMGVGVIFPYPHFSINIFYEAFPWWLFDMYFYFLESCTRSVVGESQETPSCWCSANLGPRPNKIFVEIQFIFNLSSQYILLSLHLPIISCVWFVYIYSHFYWCVKYVICISWSLVA